MKQTPIYGLPYIEGQDLVSDAPKQFHEVAEGTEKVLREIDARATPEGATPVTATNLATLATLTGVNGQSGIVTAGGLHENGLYYNLNGEWYPIEARQKRVWGARFRRTDNSLGLNNDTTNMAFGSVTGSTDLKVGNDGKGGFVTLPAGRWLMGFFMQFTGMSDGAWVGLGLNLTGGATGILPTAAEYSTSGGGFQGISLVTVIESDGTGRVQVAFSSTSAGSLRVPGQINAMEL